MRRLPDPAQGIIALATGRCFFSSSHCINLFFIKSCAEVRLSSTPLSPLRYLHTVLPKRGDSARPAVARIAVTGICPGYTPAVPPVPPGINVAGKETGDDLPLGQGAVVHGCILAQGVYKVGQSAQDRIRTGATGTSMASTTASAYCINTPEAGGQSKKTPYWSL